MKNYVSPPAIQSIKWVFCRGTHFPPFHNDPWKTVDTYKIKIISHFVILHVKNVCGRDDGLHAQETATKQFNTKVDGWNGVKVCDWHGRGYSGLSPSLKRSLIAIQSSVGYID